MNRDRRHNLSKKVLAGMCGLLLIGCDRSSPPASTADDYDSSASLPQTLFLSVAPNDPVPIPQLKKTAQVGDEVVLRVVIGGRVRPFVENRAIMTVVEAAIRNQCTLPGDACKTPWDYCCEKPEALKENMATVQINDDQGKPLKVNLEDTAQLKPLATILVQGTVGPRPDAQTLMVNASGIYVETP